MSALKRKGGKQRERTIIVVDASGVAAEKAWRELRSCQPRWRVHLVNSLPAAVEMLKSVRADNIILAEAGFASFRRTKTWVDRLRVFAPAAQVVWLTHARVTDAETVLNGTGIDWWVQCDPAKPMRLKEVIVQHEISDWPARGAWLLPPPAVARMAN